MLAKRYKIIRLIGQGGMADVYLATDTILDRQVALKILRGELASDPVALLRFKREAEAISQLSHQNIVKIFDVGEADGKQFIAMEYVEGQTLKQLIISRGALYKEEAVSIMKQLAGGVSAANEKGIIHRDLKPQNIIIKADGAIKITDFGIAATQDAVQLTQQDSVMGSIHYLAPEIARGEVVNAQSDIYSLGIIFYELLTGDVPYRGKTTVEIAMMHLRDELPSVKKLNPSLPQAVENIVIKATAKNRDYRYLSAKEMYQDLLTALDPKRAQEPKLVIKDKTPHSETKLLTKLDGGFLANKRQRLIVGLGGGTLALMLLFFLFSILSNSGNDRLVVIPNVANLSIAEATQQLEQAGFTVDLKKNEVITENIEKNLVVQTTPVIGAKIERGSKIVLTISKGQLFEVADYRGWRLETLKAILSKTNIDIVVQKEINNLEEPGTILSQSGLVVGDKIDPTIRKEIIVTVAEPAHIVLQPSWLGRSVYEIEQQLMDSGIKVKLVLLDEGALTDEERNFAKETVVRMNPVAGTFYEQKTGQEVTLYYHRLEPNEE